jgi:hypothetical protein
MKTIDRLVQLNYSSEVRQNKSQGRFLLKRSMRPQPIPILCSEARSRILPLRVLANCIDEFGSGLRRLS